MFGANIWCKIRFIVSFLTVVLHLILKNHKILPPRLVFFLKCSCLQCIAHRKLKHLPCKPFKVIHKSNKMGNDIVLNFLDFTLCFPKWHFPWKMDLLDIFFISIPQNIVLFSRQSEMLALKQHYLSKKQGNFSYLTKAKCFSFHGLRKCVASKEQHFV